jgi:hypothetical protein
MNAATALAAAKTFVRGCIGARMLNWRERDVAVHPLADDKRAQKIVDSLPYDNPRQALEDVNHWLRSLSETPALTLARRYALIDLLDAATRRCQRSLLDHYLTLPQQSFVEEKRIWNTATEFWTLLGSAYLDCARQCGDRKEIARSFAPGVAVLAARGMRALRYEIKWTSLRYGAIRTDIWDELRCFAALAESAGEAAQPLELYADHAPSDSHTSPNGEFLRLVMFWTMSPSGLSPAAQDVAERLVMHLTPKFRLLARHETASDYFFDLAGTHPPLRLMRFSPWSETTRYFDAGIARQAVQSLHALVSSSGYVPPGLDLGPAAEAGVIARALNHLLLNWAAEMRPRATARRKTELALQVLPGYANALSVVAPASDEGLDFQHTLAAESWVTEDVSDSGYGVIVPAGTGESLRAGSIVATRVVPDLAWQVAVIRRVNTYANQQRHIGVQVLSTAAAPVHLRSMSGAARGGERQWAILLNEPAASDGRLDILVRSGLLSGRELIEARFGSGGPGGANGDSVVLESQGVVESGHDYDWLSYRPAMPYSAYEYSEH